MTKAKTFLGPSGHLSWAELACKDDARTPYPQMWRATRALALAHVFEALREAVGLPLTVLSGYRTPAHNRAIGGARASQHVEGRALDLRPPPDWSIAALAQEAARIPRIRGIGLYPTFLHIDVRPTARRAVWQGSRMLADLEAFR